MRKNRAFSLLEAIVGILIIGLVAVGSVSGVFYLFGNQRESRDRALALNYAQKAVEEVRQTASNTNGFDTLATVYNGALTSISGTNFSRSISVVTSPAPLNNYLKKINVRISWDNGAREQTLSSLVAYPPMALPGNIVGNVTNADTGAYLSGATVNAQHTSGTITPTWSGSIVTDGSNYNYKKDNVFILEPGNYDVSATAGGYSPGAFSGNPVTVSQGQEKTGVNIALAPLPDPGSLSVTIFLDSNGNNSYNSGEPIISSGVSVGVYSKGSLAQDNNGNTIARSNVYGTKLYDGILPPGRYTANTTDVYNIGYCGNIANSSEGTVYHYNGWSSTLSSSNWNGSAALDNIEILSGETTYYYIPLRLIPTSTLQGHITDAGTGQVVGGSSIYVRLYYNKSGPNRYATATALSSADPGYYVFYNLPKSGYIFNYSPHKLISASGGSSARTDICGYGTKSYYSDLPKFPSSVLTLDLTVPSYLCGRAEGKVTRQGTTTPLSGVYVKISSKSNYTNGSGNYCIPSDCASFSLAVGKHYVYGYRDWFYDYQSPAQIDILEGESTTFDFEMQPVGMGTIRGRVTKTDGSTPIAGATVTVSYYGGAPNPSDDTTSTTTDANGYYSLTRVVETRGGNKHSVMASRSGFNNQTQGGITVNNGGTTTVNFTLVVQGSGV